MLFLDRAGTVRLKLAGACEREVLQEIVETLLQEAAPAGTPAEPDHGDGAGDAGEEGADK